MPYAVRLKVLLQVDEGMGMRILTALVASSLLLAACGGADAPDSLARTDSSTTTAAPTTAAPTTQAPLVLTIPDDPANMEFSEEELATLSLVLDTPEGRKLVADGLVAETDLTPDQAACFVEEVELSLILSLASSNPLEGEANTDVIMAFGTCEIDIATLSDL